MTQHAVAATHPRPQLTRPVWIDLNGQWQFAYDDAGVGIAEHWCERADVFDRVIQVPFPPESAASGIGDTGFHPVVWYRRTFNRDDVELAPHGRLLLHFGAVDYRANVWVNGHLVATHEGGHTPFCADVTEVMTASGDQIITVRAEDHPGDLSQPRGKQYWEEQPKRIWYHRTTGIWQPVWLEPVPEAYVESLRWTPDIDRATLGLSLRLSCPDERPLRLRVVLRLRDEVLVDDEYAVRGAEVHRGISLPAGSTSLKRQSMLWSPGNPNLVEATITVLADNGVVDEVESYVGLRSVGVSGGRFLLNGRPYFLRLVLEQGYWPESHLAAPDEGALRREVELVKSLGFNGVRIHQKVEDPRFLYWCDRLGLLVWGEAANAYEFSTGAIDRLTREWLEVLARDYSHPCIITWVPLNESWGVPNLERAPEQRNFVRAMFHLTKSIDPSRPAIGNDGWEHIVSDIFGVHDYAQDGQTLRRRYGSHEAVEQTLQRVQPHYRSVVLPGLSRNEEPLMVTEFGGITLVNDDERFFNAYGTVSTEQEFLERYVDLIEALTDSPVVAGFCYTQLTDTMQERNGLVDAERKPKVDVDTIRQITSRTAAAVPGDALARLQADDEVAESSAGGWS